MAVGVRARAWRPDAIGDVKDDAGEGILIDEDLLIIRHLAQLAASGPGVRKAASYEEQVGGKRIRPSLYQSRMDAVVRLICVPYVGKVGGQLALQGAAKERGGDVLRHPYI